MWELSVHRKDGSGGDISQEEAVLRSGGGIQVSILTLAVSLSAVYSVPH